MICKNVESQRYHNERISRRKYYFLETIIGTEDVAIFPFLIRALRICVRVRRERVRKEAGRSATGGGGKAEGGREKQVGATPCFKSTKHHIRRTNFPRYSTLLYSSSHSLLLSHLPRTSLLSQSRFSPLRSVNVGGRYLTFFLTLASLLSFVCFYPPAPPVPAFQCSRLVLAIIEMHFTALDKLRSID